MKTSMASGIKDIAMTLSGRITCTLLALGVQSLLAWFLLPEGRGSFAVCLTFSTLLIFAFSFGCDTASVYFIASKRVRLSEGILYACILGSLASVAAVSTGYALLQLPLSFTTKATAEAFHLALALIPAALFAEMFLQILTALGKFKVYAVMLVFRVFSRLVLIVICVTGLSWGVKGAIFAWASADVLVALMLAGFYTIRCGVSWVRPRLQDLWEMFLYGTRYYLGRLSNMVNIQLGTVVLAFFAPKDQIGVFSLACVVVFQIDIIPDTVMAILVPRVSTHRKGDPELVAQCARVAGVVCAVLLIGLALSATPLIRIVFSPAFLPAADLVGILVIGAMARSCCKVFVPYLLATNHPTVASMSVFAGMTVNVLLMLLLFPVLGLYGAALSVTVNYLVSSFILAASFSRLSGLSIREVFSPRRSDWEPLHALFVFGSRRELSRHRLEGEGYE